MQGDSIKLRIRIIEPSGGSGVYIPVSGITLDVALGPKPNTGTYHARQVTWTPSADLADPYFEAILALNTPAIDALLAGVTEAATWFEVKMFQDALPTTVLSKQVQISAAVILPGTVTPAPGDTPLSAEVANATYLKRVIIGSFEQVSADGLHRVSIYVDASGWHADPIA